MATEDIYKTKGGLTKVNLRLTHGPHSLAALNEEFFQRYPMLEIRQSKKEIAGLGLFVPRGCREVEPSRCSERAGALSWL